MLNLTLLLQENYKKLPWKNGLGATNEIVIILPDADFRTGNKVKLFNLALGKSSLMRSAMMP